MKAPEITSILLSEMAALVKPGVTTASIDDYAEKRIPELGATSYNKGYWPRTAKVAYPAVSCINIGMVIAHGVPSQYILQEGDIVGLDIGIRDADGNCGDAALTVGCGTLSNRNERLRYYAKKTLYAGIQRVRAGVDTYEITHAMENYAMMRGYKINRVLGGHGISKEMHEPPHIYNIDQPGNEYVKLKAGQVICIEPMLTHGRDDRGIVAPDGWTVFCADGKESAVFEHMVEVTETGFKVLTTHFSDEVYN